MRTEFLRSFAGLLLCVVLHVACGRLVGVLFPPGPWVDQLNKPGFYPPAWMFPAVWTVLYAMMGLSLWFLVRAKSKAKKSAYAVYALQLTVNYAFSPIFFGMRNTFSGFLDVALLLVVLLATIIRFYRISKTAALLLLPYALWVMYALVLSYSLWRLNS